MIADFLFYIIGLERSFKYIDNMKKSTFHIKLPTLDFSFEIAEHIFNDRLKRYTLREIPYVINRCGDTITLIKL